MSFGLGRRVGLLIDVLDFPTGKGTQRGLVDAIQALDDRKLLNFDDTQLSKTLRGAGNTDRFEGCSDRLSLIRAVVKYLDGRACEVSSTFWADHCTSPEELILSLQKSRADFFEDLARLSHLRPSNSSSNKPTSAEVEPEFLPSLERIGREDAEKLYQQLGGYCFFYRLGAEREFTEDERAVPVLRRIPVKISDIGKTYLLYRDKYTQYDVTPGGNDYATGRVYFMREHITVLAEDNVDRGLSELFLVQLQERPRKVRNEDIFEGLILMNGDLNRPTVCRVIFKKAPKTVPKMDWAEFAARCELKVALKRGDGGSLRLLEPQSIDEDPDREVLDEYISLLRVVVTDGRFDLH